MCAKAINTRKRNVQFEISKACNYSPLVFLPILFGVCADIILIILIQGIRIIRIIRTVRIF